MPDTREYKSDWPITRRAAVLGATLETPNLGVGALAAGAVTCMLSAFPDAQVYFLDYAKAPSVRTVAFQGKRVSVPLLNMRFSWKIAMGNNIALLLALAVVYRLIPFAAGRRLLTRGNKCLREITSTDVFGAVSGGDSFSDIYGLRRFIYVTLPQILVLLLGKPLYLFPQTYGPFRREWPRRVARWIVSRAERAWCRDRSSLCELMSAEDLNSDSGRMAFGYDMAFGIDSIAPARFDIEGAALEVPGKTIVGLNISGLLWRGGYTSKNEFGLRENYRELVHSIIDAVLAYSDTTLLLVPHVFGPATDVESDEAATEQVNSVLRDVYAGRIAMLRGIYDPQEIRHVIGGCDFFIGSRMHACIGAISQGVPAVCIAYSDKFAAVMRTIGMDDLVTDARAQSREEIIGTIAYGLQERLAIKRELAARIAVIRKAAVDLLRPEILCEVPEGMQLTPLQ